MESTSTQLGRPVKFTSKMQAEIVRLVGEGNYLDVACKAVGIAPRTLRHWRQAHRAGDPAMVEHDDFFAALEKALAIAETISVADARSGRPGWQGQAWFLERRYPKRWARKDRVAPAPTSESTTYDVQYSDPAQPGSSDAP